MLSARNRELFGLLPVALAVSAGFTAVLIARGAAIEDLTLGYGALFLGLCLAGHFLIRLRLPDADPFIYPLASALAGVGIVMIYRIDPELAREQAQWFVLGLGALTATLVLLRDLTLLERYRYTIAAAAMVLLLLPRVTGGITNGAYLRVDLGPVEFQPAELAKIAVVVFVAAYLADTRELMVAYERRFLGVSLPPARYFGPMLLVWALAMMLLVFIRDLGSSVMFFGGFLALLYMATTRVSYAALGLAMFVVGFLFFESTVGHVGARVDAWLDPLDPDLYFAAGGSGQIAQSMFAQADGGLFGAGFGQALLTAGGDPVLPAAQTDLIYAVVVNELGFAGALGLLLIYLLFVQRGLKTAMLATDPFPKLLAAGLTAVFALQVFVIVGGVTRVIPLTGVTLPFVSYGGSSIVANFILVGLLLIVSDGVRRRRAEGGLL